uniref:Putative secreted peptide n=1 Tax=Anopheles braziliensis TaxID=58242 RepID=A0A2M3ZWJ9_9DIPT
MLPPPLARFVLLPFVLVLPPPLLPALQSISTTSQCANTRLLASNMLDKRHRRSSPGTDTKPGTRRNN